MSSESVRIGVFLCECHDEGSCDMLDFKRLKAFLNEYEDIVFVGEYDHMCSAETLQAFKDNVKSMSLNRVVLGMCSPTKHLEKFRDAAEEVGLNRFLVDGVNMREQVAFIHLGEPEEMQVKLADQFAMAIAKARVSRPASEIYAVVDDLRCNGCHICATVCDKGAIEMIPDPSGRVKEISRIDAEQCVGCGVCVTSCPVAALDMTVHSNAEMNAQLDSFIERMRPDKLNVLVLSCQWCAYPAADAAGSARLPIRPDFRHMMTLCTGRADPDWMLKAITRGADGVLLLGGKAQACHFKSGNIRTMSRMKLVKLFMSQLGLDDKRLQVKWVDPADGKAYADAVNEFIEDLSKMGPNPLLTRDEDYSSAKANNRR